MFACLLVLFIPIPMELIPRASACPLESDLVSWVKRHPSSVAALWKCLLKKESTRLQLAVLLLETGVCSPPRILPHRSTKQTSLRVTLNNNGEVKCPVFVKGSQKTGEELRQDLMLCILHVNEIFKLPFHLSCVVEHPQQFFEQIFSFQAINSSYAKRKLLGSPV